jgi:hypothetical protein
MDALAAEYAEDVHHLFVYTRETHPEYARGIYEHFETIEEKFARAKILQERFNTPRKILVDDLDGTVHRLYAGVPNQSWVIDHTGHIAYKAGWTDAADVRMGLELALRTRELKREGRGGTSYYRELFTTRTSNRQPGDSESLAQHGVLANHDE